MNGSYINIKLNGFSTPNRPANVSITVRDSHRLVKQGTDENQSDISAMICEQTEGRLMTNVRSTAAGRRQNFRDGKRHFFATDVATNAVFSYRFSETDVGRFQIPFRRCPTGRRLSLYTRTLRCGSGRLRERNNGGQSEKINKRNADRTADGLFRITRTPNLTESRIVELITEVITRKEHVSSAVPACQVVGSILRGGRNVVSRSNRRRQQQQQQWVVQFFACTLLQLHKQRTCYLLALQMNNAKTSGEYTSTIPNFLQRCYEIIINFKNQLKLVVRTHIFKVCFYFRSSRSPRPTPSRLVYE